jgi:hypothetical protein
MKTLKNLALAFLLWCLLFASACAFGQSNFRLNKVDSFNFAIVIDPSASIEKKGLNIGAEIEYIGTVYTRTSVTSFSSLNGGYIDFVGAAGLNFTSGYFEQLRYYAGGRLGVIRRGGNGYPTAGIECGIDYTINRWVLGIRATRDRRGDFEFYNESPEMRNSGFVKIGRKL